MKKRTTLRSYRWRVSLVIALFAIIPFSFLCANYVAAEQTKLEQVVYGQYAQNMEASSMQLSRTVRDMENKIHYVKNNTKIRGYLNRIQKLNLVDALQFIYELQDTEAAVRTDNEALEIKWYAFDGSYNYGGYCHPISALTESFAEDKEQLDKILNLKRDETAAVIRTEKPGSKQWLLSIYTKITNITGSDCVLALTIPMHSILNVIQSGFPDNSIVGIRTDVGDRPTIIMPNDRPAEDYNSLKKYYEDGSIDGYYSLEVPLAEFRNGTITCLLQETHMTNLNRGGEIRILFIFVLLVASVIIGSYLASGLLTQRVFGFVERLHRELEAEMPEREKTKIKDKSFLDIEDRLRKLVSDSRDYGRRMEQYERKKKEMELELLQMRFNPHFLYNTLGSIRYQIKDERIRKSIDSLISYYRIVLSKGALLVSIESEIKMIEDYLNLQVFSFDIQNIQVVYHVDESVKKYMIVKHLLQPIVENALEHGVRGKEEGGTIFVNAGLEGENVVFEIKDTGVGMTPEQIKEVTSGVSGSGQSGGYGIYNVIQRIKAYYGPQYGVEFFSEWMKGTRVIITIPKEFGTERENAHEDHGVLTNRSEISI